MNAPTVLAAACGLAMLGQPSHAAYLPVSAYQGFTDSPFAAGSFDWFHLERFESGGIAVPGVTSSASIVLNPGALTDSVDEDDGVIDGNGNAGRSLYVTTNTVTFTFNAGALGGSLPTHAGMVFTDVGFASPVDMFGDVVFEAFDQFGVSLGTITALNLGDGSAGGGTLEDRFFGVINLGGISAISLTMPGSFDWEVDHLQYGRIPAPGAGLVLLGAGMIACRRRRGVSGR